MKTNFLIPDDANVTDLSYTERKLNGVEIHGMFKIRIDFSNGYSLSIIKGKYSYGGEEGFYEIAPIGKEGGLNGELLGFEHDDDVKGWLTVDRVNDYISQMNKL